MLRMWTSQVGGVLSKWTAGALEGQERGYGRKLDPRVLTMHLEVFAIGMPPPPAYCIRWQG